MTKSSKPYRPRFAWERAILDALDSGEPATLGDIIERVGIRVSPADREAAYRALEHLADRSEFRCSVGRDGFGECDNADE